MNQEPIINNQGVAPASTGEINTEQDAIERAAVKQAELVNYEKNKANKGLLFGLILCLIFAIGGIGFGVYEMIDGNTKVDKLNKQNNALQAQNNELAEKLAALQGEGKDENTADYIYVGEWGMKIKISNGLQIDKYEFIKGADDGHEYSKVDIYAGGENSYPLGVVIRFDKDYEYAQITNPNGPLFSDDDYDYYISGPNGDIPSDLGNAKDLVDKMISDNNNYSKI